MHDTDRTPAESASARTDHDDPAHPDSFATLVVVVSLISIGLTIFSVFTVYQNLQLKRRLREPRSFAECVQSPGSRTEERNPAVCVTRDGYRVVQTPVQSATK